MMMYKEPSGFEIPKELEIQKLPPHQAGMMVVPNSKGDTDFLPLASVDIKVEIVDSLSHISLT